VLLVVGKDMCCSSLSEILVTLQNGTFSQVSAGYVTIPDNLCLPHYFNIKNTYTDTTLKMVI
jgi:hypothetical protein